MTNKFSADIADKLLDKLSSDDAFRELFQSDARAALAQIGYHTPTGDQGVRGSDPLMCCSVKGLASKETIRAGRAKLRAALTSTLPQAMFDFCSS